MVLAQTQCPAVHRSCISRRQLHHELQYRFYPQLGDGNTAAGVNTKDKGGPVTLKPKRREVATPPVFHFINN